MSPKSKTPPSKATKKVREEHYANLLFECCEQLRRSNRVDLAYFLKKLPDQQSRDEFKLDVSMAGLIDACYSHETRSILEEATMKPAKLSHKSVENRTTLS